MAKHWGFIAGILSLLLLSLAITASAEELPDLAVKGVYVNSGGVLVVDQVNNGAVVSTLDGRTDIWIDGSLVWTYTWATLEAPRQLFLQANGASSINPMIFTLTGSHTVEACVDAENIVVESDESNNCMGVKLADDKIVDVRQKIAQRFGAKFLKPFRPIKPTGMVVGGFEGKTATEQVKCVFHGSTAEESCSVAGDSESSRCAGVETCIADVQGAYGTQFTWKSSCGGYAYTTIDGTSDYIEFKCGADENAEGSVDFDLAVLEDARYELYARGVAGADVVSEVQPSPRQKQDLILRFARPTASALVAHVCARGETFEGFDIQFKVHGKTNDLHYAQPLAAGSCVRVESEGYEVFGVENVRALKEFSVWVDSSQSYGEVNEGNNHFKFNREHFLNFLRKARGEERKEMNVKPREKQLEVRRVVREKLEQRFEDADFDKKLYARVLAESQASVETPVASEDEGCAEGQCETPANVCVGVGLRALGDDKIPVYCDVSGELLPQKGMGAACQNNFECATNSCNSGVCTDLIGELRETQSMVKKLFSWLERLFK